MLTTGRTFPLCESCVASLGALSLGPHCTVCAEPLGHETATSLQPDGIRCGVCTGEPRPFVRATAYGPYEALRYALRIFKFEGVASLAVPLGALLAEAVMAQAGEFAEDVVVVPVPLYRRRKRGYNQSLLLAQRALRNARPRCERTRFHLRPNVLRRVHQREEQYGLSPEQRRQNVRGAFQVRGDVCGRHVLLIDDVFTTGATCSECCSVLMAAGAACVRVATLARAGLAMPERWSPEGVFLQRTALKAHPQLQLTNMEQN